MRVYRKEHELKSTITEGELAARAVSEYIGDEIQILNAEFLQNKYSVLLATRAKGIILAFFFKESGLLAPHFTQLLGAYVLCRKNWETLAKSYPLFSFSDVHELSIMVFIPDQGEAWDEIADLVKAPVRIVTYQAIGARDEQAIVLDVEEKVLSTQKFSPPPADKEDHQLLSEPVPPPRESFFQRAKLNAEEIRALLDLDLQLESAKSR